MAQYVSRQVNRLSIPKLKSVNSRTSLERYENSFPQPEFTTVQRINLNSLEKQHKTVSRSQSLEKCDNAEHMKNLIVTEKKSLQAKNSTKRLKNFVNSQKGLFQEKRGSRHHISKRLPTEPTFEAKARLESQESLPRLLQTDGSVEHLKTEQNY